MEIREEPISALTRHTAIPIAFTVEQIYDPLTGGVRAVESPWVKDYDVLEHPLSWPEQFDVSRWAILSAWSSSERIGGVVMGFAAPGVEMLEGRDDLAVIWDLRVAPAWRRRRVGATLMRAAREWAVAMGCRELKVETQNINAAACLLYRASGFELVEVNAGAYAGLPDEVQLIWVKTL